MSLVEWMRGQPVVRATGPRRRGGPARRPDTSVRGGILAAALALSAAAAAQTPLGPAAEERLGDLGLVETASGLRVAAHAIPGASHAAIVAAVRVGPWHDPPGRTGLTLLLNAQVALTQDVRPEQERWTVKTTGPATILAHTCPAPAVEERLRELARFLAGELPFDDDLLARAKARVLMDADTFAHIVPGPLLIESARRTVCAGTPAGKQMFGVPEEIRALGRDELESWYAARVRPEHTTLVVLGGIDPARIGTLCREAFDVRGERTPPAATTVHDSAPPVQSEQPHGRIAAPFVSVAIPAPAQDSPRWLPFVIAMNVVTLRAQKAFGGYRGREAEAMFPFTWFDYRHGDAFALLNRRGASPEEGAVVRDVDAVRRELLALIKRLRTLAPDYDEVRQAAYEATTSLALPPYAGQLETMARHPGLLMPRAELLAMADVLRWRGTLQADIGKVPVTEVVRVLQESFADDNLTWLALVPKH